MNARILLRNAKAGASSIRPAASATGSVQRQVALQRRFAASDAMGEALVHERNHSKDHAGKSADLWRKVSIYGCIPFAAVMGYYIYQIEAEHIHHRDHEIEANGGELPEAPKYEYNDLRKKPFPWASEGKDNSFFFNPKANRSVDL